VLVFYHSLEHAESLEAKHQCLQSMQKLLMQRSMRQQKVAINALIIAQKHGEIVLQLGGFPHRNEALGSHSRLKGWLISIVVVSVLDNNLLVFNIS
jgi:uncharacterized protein (DUF924 family)